MTLRDILESLCVSYKKRMSYNHDAFLRALPYMICVHLCSLYTLIRSKLNIYD